MSAGERAIAAARAHCPDLIVSDVRLAEGCGVAAVEEICRDHRANVVFVTGYKLHPGGGFGPGRIRATVLTSRIESREFCVGCSLQCGALDVAAAGTNALTAFV